MRSLHEPAGWMAVTLSSDGLISLVSECTEQMTGYAARELIGRPITEILADDSAFQVPHMMDAALESGCWEGEVVYRNRSGLHLTAGSQLLTLSSQEKLKCGFLLTCRISSDSDLPSVFPDLGAGRRLQIFTHEVNNPLAVMMGFAQLLLLNPECRGKVRADVEKIFGELQRVIQTVENLHEYALSLQADRSKTPQ
jgi:PAS domain S-box-containing protein